MSVAAATPDTAMTLPQQQWARIATSAPMLASTAQRYLAQIGLSLRPSSVVVADGTLRLFAGYLVAEQTDVGSFAEVGRREIEGFKTWLAARRTPRGGPVSANTVRQRLGMLRTFFDRIIEWDWPDAPARTPIFATDLPTVDDPLPKFLDDAQAARLLRAAATQDPLTRLVIELLAHTGIRVGELCDLADDAVVNLGGSWWLRVPVGKLHNDRYVPLLATLVEQLAAWTAAHPHNRSGRLLVKDGTPLNRHRVTRMLNRVAKAAGLGHVNPHRLRHTLATQAINRGMRLEAVAALLGHRSLRMTMVYARIANRTVAAEYHAVSEKVEALYAEPDYETAEMRQLRVEHRRMLGNGWCTRPTHLDCSFESVCEGCGFFATTVEFKPRLEAQRDHAAAHGQTARTSRYQQLLDRLDQTGG
ncbi:MAG TPA: tyrosine-type recombinase/integrase [Mycobacterium sp.]|jgi:integrase|nr:tyrosine-type recombinase/integrase [Mycobacterium sp.]